MKLDLKELPVKLTELLTKLKQYASFIFVLLILGAFGFLTIRIRGYVSSEPSDEAVNEKLSTLQRPRIDQKTIDKIQQLEDNSVQVKSLFEQARDNPFQE